MNPPQLKLAELAAGLLKYGARYAEIHAFADDIDEIRQLYQDSPPPNLRPADVEGRVFSYEHEGTRFVVELSDNGVVKLRRDEERPHDGNQTAGAAITGGVAGAAIGAATSKKGDGWAAGLVLGLLAGAMLGSGSSQDAPRRVLTMRFDPESRQWQAYDGGLVNWMKSELQSA